MFSQLGCQVHEKFLADACHQLFNISMDPIIPTSTSTSKDDAEGCTDRLDSLTMWKCGIWIVSLMPHALKKKDLQSEQFIVFIQLHCIFSPFHGSFLMFHGLVH